MAWKIKNRDPAMFLVETFRFYISTLHSWLESVRLKVNGFLLFPQCQLFYTRWLSKLVNYLRLNTWSLFSNLEKFSRLGKMISPFFSIFISFQISKCFYTIFFSFLKKYFSTFQSLLIKFSVIRKVNVGII